MLSSRARYVGDKICCHLGSAQRVEASAISMISAGGASLAHRKADPVSVSQAIESRLLPHTPSRRPRHLANFGIAVALSSPANTSAGLRLGKRGHARLPHYIAGSSPMLRPSFSFTELTCSIPHATAHASPPRLRTYLRHFAGALRWLNPYRAAGHRASSCLFNVQFLPLKTRSVGCILRLPNIVGAAIAATF